MTTVSELQDWYIEQCNGRWEHQHGVSIETLDNPGWKVHIDLAETPLSGARMKRLEESISETDWLTAYIENDQFIAFGGAQSLERILATFAEVSKTNTS